MANCLTRRLFFWKNAFYSKVRAVMGVLITAFTIILIVRDGIIDPANRNWYLLKFIPNLSWYWWALVGLIALLCLALEGAYVEHRTLMANYQHRHKARLSDLKREHQLQLANARLETLIKRNEEGKEKEERKALSVTPDAESALAEALGVETQAKAQKNLVIAQWLNHYLKQGDRILKQCARHANAPITDLVAWETDVEGYIREQLGEADALEFGRDYPTTPYPDIANNRQVVDRLHTKLQRLGGLITELLRD